MDNQKEEEYLERSIIQSSLIRLDRLYAEVEAKRKEAKQLLHDIQESCSHPLAEIVEGAYKERAYFDTLPPFRVCRLCGYNEPGWGNFLRLAPNSFSIPSLSRDDAMKYVRGGLMDYEEKDRVRQALLDKEKEARKASCTSL